MQLGKAHGTGAAQRPPLVKTSIESVCVTSPISGLMREHYPPVDGASMDGGRK
jgi:hypothetical protein